MPSLTLTLLTTLLAAPASAEAPHLQRPHYRCIVEVAKTKDARVRLVSSQNQRSFALVRGARGSNPGYYLVDMADGRDANVSFLDGRVTQYLSVSAVKETLPPELLQTLQQDVASAGVNAGGGDGARYAAPTPVKNEEAYGRVSETLLATLRESKQLSSMPTECHAFPELSNAITDQSFGVAAPAAPTKNAPPKTAPNKK